MYTYIIACNDREDCWTNYAYVLIVRVSLTDNEKEALRRTLHTALGQWRSSRPDERQLLDTALFGDRVTIETLYGEGVWEHRGNDEYPFDTEFYNIYYCTLLRDVIKPSLASFGIENGEYDFELCNDVDEFLTTD